MIVGSYKGVAPGIFLIIIFGENPLKFEFPGLKPAVNGSQEDTGYSPLIDNVD